jgi:hypothetical protein
MVLRLPARGEGRDTPGMPAAFSDVSRNQKFARHRTTPAMLPTFKQVVTFTGCTLIGACSPVRTATVGAISPMDPEAILAGAVGDGPAGEARTES